MNDTTTQIKEALEDALYWIDAAGKEASMTEPKVELASGFAVRSAAHIRLALSALSAAQPLELGEEEIERACVVMHDAYEAAAEMNEWKTQEASNKPWADVPLANKATMRVAVRALAAHWLRGRQPVAEPVAWMATDGRHVVSKTNYDNMSFISRGGYPIPLGVLPAGQQGIGDKPSVEEIMEVIREWVSDKEPFRKIMDAIDVGHLRTRLQSLLDRSAPNSTPA